MKEQVSVDHILEIIGYLSFKGDDKRSKVLSTFVRQYLDLKLLDDNRQNLINRYRAMGKNIHLTSITNEDCIDELESLSEK